MLCNKNFIFKLFFFSSIDILTIKIFKPGNDCIISVKNKITKPVNLGSGKGVSIKRIVNILNNIYKEKKIKIHWKKNFSGDKKRLMDMSYMHKLGFKSNYTMEQAIKITANWFEKNNKIYKDRFKYF